MTARGAVAVLACVLAGGLAACSAKSSGSGSAPSSASSATAQPSTPDPWPRQVQLSNATVLVYQPQVESWQGNQLTFRSAVAATPSGSDAKTYGVIWGSARTEVDRINRRVTLEDLALTRSKFPTLPDNGASYLSQLQQQLPAAARTISLDRLQASLAASGSFHAAATPVQNTPPRIIVSYSPAVLVPIAGTAVVRKVPDTRFERVINTRALIARTRGSATFYLHLYDGWLSAPAVDGPWARASSPPRGLDDLAKKLAASGQVDLLDGDGAQPKPSLANGVPAIYVTHQPAELIVFKGQPNLQPIASTGLLWATNTTADVIVDTSNNNYYVLISGRWFTAPALGGPWSFVASNALPAAFATIPATSPAGVVLAAVAGTPQAQEAVIENSVPQTATVQRVNGPSFMPSFDGTPQWTSIAGTPLAYVANSPTPIIRVNASAYYALSAGIWFTAASAYGPWSIATAVPDVIYTIPPSSPLYYVTYVHVYGSTPTVVYEGYTPGYLGTVVAPDGTVVYGTGYDYQPWIGTTYYAAPVTYGIGAVPVYNPAVGYTYGMALGLTTAAMVDSWDYPTYYSAGYYGYPCCGSASANVYGHWGDTVTSGTDTWYDTSSGTYGEKASGSYENYRTGTTGTYSANRSWNPYTGEGQRGYQRSVDTLGGTTGNVSRSETYDAQTGQTSYGSSMSAQGAGGSTVSRTTSASAGPEGTSASRDTTTYNAQTGQTHTYSSGSDGADRYAGADGNVYKNDGSGWQSSTGNSWQKASGDTSWANAEQQARSQSENRFSGFQNGGWANRFQGGGGGGGGLADRFGGGGFGDRFGGGGFGGFRGGGGFRR